MPVNKLAQSALLLFLVVALAGASAPKANTGSTNSTAAAATSGTAATLAPVAKSPTKGGDKDDSQEFHQKLVDMLARTEKSIKLIREQIIQNQSAPFLPDLYLQLADLLAEKANVLYYQKIEKEKDSNVKLKANEKFNPIVTADQEAIGIYQQILKEFPNFDKRDKTLYRLAVAQKAIDDSAPFSVTAETLIKEFPKTKEAMQVRLLLGQLYIDQQDFKMARTVLEPVADSAFPFERNSARYRLGIIAMTDEKFKEALQRFEKVATDEELKEEDNPLEVSIKDRTVHSNIKREALIDSVRAYTEVFKKDPDPINYYSQVAPTEVLFQEVIEKLAYRYIFLKNQGQAMKLLRALSERVADPQKVVTIYREVLSIIPPLERVEVPPQEMQYVLEKYGAWLNDFEIDNKTREQSYEFFETQIREMGTRSHDLAKSELSQARKDFLYERARQFYHLYLGFFKKGPMAVKMATDLADVYYYQKNFLRAGDYYLRIYQGEFGPPIKSNQESLLQNAVLCFQKKYSNDFYEITRSRGLLLKAVQTYMVFDPKKKADPKLNFVLVKTIYEQGLYKQALPALVQFISKFPSAHTEDEAATDVILDYFNTRSDFKGLIDWSTRILQIKTLAADIRNRLETVKNKAQLKQIDEQVKSKAGYDPFGQGKSYFETALTLQDESLKSVALEQALARSKSEKDIATFLRVAKAMAEAEKDPEKKAQILVGMGEQTLAIGGFYVTLDMWRQATGISGLQPARRQQIQEKMVRLTIMLKDWPQMMIVSRGVNSTLAQSMNQQYAEYMEGATLRNEDLISPMSLGSLGDPEMTALFKGRYKVSASAKANIDREVQARCSRSKEPLVCRWLEARRAPQLLTDFDNKITTAPPKLESVELGANALNAYLQSVKIFSETGDPQLDGFAALYIGRAYSDFAAFLNRVGAANPQLAMVLKAKANESLMTAKQESGRCAKIVEAASLVSPVNAYCQKTKLPSLEEAITWSSFVKDTARATDPKSPTIADWQKKIFVEPTKPDLYLELAAEYYRARDYHHALAMSTYGISTFPQAKDDFTTVQGCALVGLGLYASGQFQLRAGSDYQNMKVTCLGRVKEVLR